MSSVDEPAELETAPAPGAFGVAPTQDISSVTRDGRQWSESVAKVAQALGGHGPVTTLPPPAPGRAESELAADLQPRYDFEEILGVGGMGTVYLVYDRDIGRHVAMKKIDVGTDAPAYQASRFADEVRALGRLEHPNIVPIYDVGRCESGDLYFTMKYVRGETLTNVIARLQAGDRATHEAWPLARRYDVFTSLLSALRYAHAQGILHLDIKPDNIMVGEVGEVIVMDWGIATFADHTESGSIIGSPPYMSPEQARGLALDARSDLYSAFAVFYELLTLDRHIESTGSTVEILAEAMEKEPPSRTSTRWVKPHQVPIPMEIRHFVCQGLTTDRDRRLASADAALADLAHIRSGDFEACCPITFGKLVQVGLSRFVERHRFAMPGLLLAVPLSALLWLVLGAR